MYFLSQISQPTLHANIATIGDPSTFHSLELKNQLVDMEYGGI
jgi:hypothetical protein